MSALIDKAVRRCELSRTPAQDSHRTSSLVVVRVEEQPAMPGSKNASDCPSAESSSVPEDKRSASKTWSGISARLDHAKVNKRSTESFDEQQQKSCLQYCPAQSRRLCQSTAFTRTRPHHGSQEASGVGTASGLRCAPLGLLAPELTASALNALDRSERDWKNRGYKLTMSARGSILQVGHECTLFTTHNQARRSCSFKWPWYRKKKGLLEFEIASTCVRPKGVCQWLSMLAACLRMYDLRTVRVSGVDNPAFSTVLGQ